jgi:hypothetical protein
MGEDDGLSAVLAQFHLNGLIQRTVRKPLADHVALRFRLAPRARCHMGLEQRVDAVVWWPFGYGLGTR